MGYYTTYKVTITDIKDADDFEWFEFKFKKTIPYLGDDLKYDEINKTVYAAFYDVKWYDCEEKLKELSTLFPNITIDVNGEGEESGDIWKMRVRNGKSERVNAVLSFPDFKELV